MSIELLNIDCMEYMKDIPDNHFDLSIVDPPYGIGESGKTNKSRSKLAISKDYKSFAGDDLEPPSMDYFIQLMRVSKHQMIWGANHFIERIVKNSSCWIVWDKVNGGSAFADCELCWTSFGSAVRKFEYRWAGMLQQRMHDKEIRIHPTQKPIDLYKWLLINYSQKGQKILDTHLGSGSSAIAAHYFGCDFVGCELDVDYFNAAVKRFDESTRQTTLFDLRYIANA